ncbi:MAG TPA: ribosome maturation factor RimM [Candidatus Krumholzibacteria bacterium]|nr:ribosome maturation factor RimM [Candidatus Krumholzibacteria bacterium]
MTDRIHLGRFVKAFGIKGELKLYASDDFWPEAFESEQLFIARETDADNERSVVIEYGKPHGGQYIVKLEGVDDRNDAEEIVGEDLFIDGNEIDVPAPDKELPHQVMGMTVRTDQGRVIGTITNVLVGPAQSVYEVTGEDGKVALIPAVPAFIVSRDDAKREIVIRVIPGLIDA